MDQNIAAMEYKIREIAGRIRELRLITGLSVEEMAQRTGISVQEYEQCEAGNRNLSIAFLYRCVLIFGVDFTFYYCILMKRYKTAFSMEEVRTYLLVVIGAVVLIGLNLVSMIGNTADTVRHSAFQVASIITTTGYSTVDFNLWPQLSQMILVALMFMGACAGSTGGGMKVSRVMVLVKSIFKEIRVLTHPKCTTKVKLNGRPLEHETLRGITVFFISYMAIFAVALLIISLDNFDFTTNFTAVVATLNNIGPGLAGVGPTQNFAPFSNFSKLVLIFDMLAGRLELFPLLLLFSRETWKKF